MKRRCGWLVILALILFGASAHASKNLPDGSERVLFGHVFMPSNYMDDPFVATTVANRVGGGSAVNLARPFYDLNGDLIFTYEGTIFYAALGLDFQQNLGETWAVKLMLDGLVRTGSNLESIFSEGANLDREVELVVKKRLLRRDRTQVSLGLVWGYSMTTIFSLREFATYIGNGGDVADAPLLVDEKVWRTKLTANAVYALTPGLGLRLNGGTGLHEEPYNPDVSKALYELSAMLDWDLNVKTAVPLGFSLGYLWGAPEDDPYTGLSGGILGVWYTGQQDLAIGVETGWWSRPVPNSTEETEGIVSLLTLRYWF